MEKNSQIRVAIVGTNGIPSQYGGYETLVEFLTKHLSYKFHFTVYCSKSQKTRIKEHNGAKLIYLPLKANGWQSIFYDIITLLHGAITSDVILYLGPGAGYFLPIIKLINKNIIVNHGGLNEWEREKYSGIQRFIAKAGHKYGGLFAKVNIADNIRLKNSLKDAFGIDSTVIRYGGDHALSIQIDKGLMDKYPFLNKKYFVNVSRAQVDNNLHLVLDAFKSSPEFNLVMISNWNVSSYGIALKNDYLNKYPNIFILDAIYEPKELNSIRGNAFAYIHSHSYCGTSPSLVEAMSLGLPIISYDVATNRETTKNKAMYFSNVEDLDLQISGKAREDYVIYSNEMKKIADKEYTWQKIASEYSNLISKMCT